MSAVIILSRRLYSSALLKPLVLNNSSMRFINSTKPHRKSIYKSESRKIRAFVISRYFEYLKNYDKILEKRFPQAMQVYRAFMDGFKDFFRDTKEYFSIIRLLNRPGNDFSKLLRREVELYEQMPKDMRKVAPILFISTLPFAYTFIFPLAYMFPRQLMCSHFWTLKQKSDFSLIYLKQRLTHNRPVFRHLQSQLDYLKCHCLHDQWAKVLGMIGSGTNPCVNDILHCKELFTTEPYHLLYLSRNHINHLLGIHDMHKGWFRRARLTERAFLLREMDKAILREGGVHNLPVEALKKCCYMRGLNPTNLSNDEMIIWLQKWSQLSSHVDKDSYSLLLHAPILLAYNAPSNWYLIYRQKSDI